MNIEQDDINTNELAIEWRHCEVGWDSCERCSATWEALTSLVGDLARTLGHKGVSLRYEETFIPPDRLDEANMVLFNGRPIEEVLPDIHVTESECEVGCGPQEGIIMARKLVRNGEEYEALPKDLLLEASVESLRTGS